MYQRQSTAWTRHFRLALLLLFTHVDVMVGLSTLKEIVRETKYTMEKKQASMLDMSSHCGYMYITIHKNKI